MWGSHVGAAPVLSRTWGPSLAPSTSRRAPSFPAYGLDCGQRRREPGVCVWAQVGVASRVRRIGTDAYYACFFFSPCFCSSFPVSITRLFATLRLLPALPPTPSCLSCRRAAADSALIVFFSAGVAACAPSPSSVRTGATLKVPSVALGTSGLVGGPTRAPMLRTLDAEQDLDGGARLAVEVRNTHATKADEPSAEDETGRDKDKDRKPRKNHHSPDERNHNAPCTVQ